MECRDVLEAVYARLAGEVAGDEAIERHLESCEPCRAEARAIEAVWERLDDDPDVSVSPAFRAKTLELLAEETARRAPADDRRVVAFRPRAAVAWRTVLQIAALLVMGVGGFLLARFTRPAETAQLALIPAANRLSVVSERTVDVSRTVPDLASRPRLTNVAFTPADPAGRVGISFDVSTRYTLIGKPEEKGIADVMVYLVAGASETEGAKGKAIDLVSRQLSEGAIAPPAIVKVLSETLRGDKNPGVRKKAAEALLQLPPTSETQQALIEALKSDTNPAVRILAVEGLAKAGRELKDPATIETLRARASDETENGYVRAQAAAALQRLSL